MRASLAAGWVERARWRAAASLLALGVGALVVAACGGSGGDVAKGESKLPEGSRSGTIEHESCDEAGHKVVVVDVNRDGKADIRRVYDNAGKEVCRVTDLNRDGKPDMFEYFGPGGEIRRREADYDDNGVVNAIEYFEGGKLVRREIDTSNQGKLDTWDFFDPQTGKRLRRERDSSGDGRVDQWWTWEGEKVTIAMDKNGDGKPDPDGTVVLGGAGGAPPPPGGAAADAGAEAGATPAPAVTTSPGSATTPPADAGTDDGGRSGAKR